MSLKLITLNIWRGGVLFENALDFLKKEDPDILALQEAYNGVDEGLSNHLKTVSQVKNLLNFPFQTFSPALLDLGPTPPVMRGNATFSKFSIEFSQSIFFDKEFSKLNCEDPKYFYDVPALLQYSIINLGEKQINFFNLHGIWGEDGLDNERRDKMIELIISKIKGKTNVILAGDFNIDQYTKGVFKIERYLHNVFRRELKTSFNLKNKKDGGFSKAVVDMIFTSFNIKILKHYCPKVDISDHLPLVAILEIK